MRWGTGGLAADPQARVNGQNIHSAPHRVLFGSFVWSISGLVLPFCLEFLHQAVASPGGCIFARVIDMGWTKTLPRLGVAGRTFLLSTKTIERAMGCGLSPGGNTQREETSWQRGR